MVNINNRKRSATCHLYSSCIVLPADKHEVAKALRIITALKVPFAVRSGGHNPNRGWASAGENAILIDMNRVCDVVLSQDKKTVEIGPGNRWQKVYETLHGSGVSVIGGRTGDVGIGGLILGGGFPSFSSEYGLACDNVRSFEVVLSDSSIVNASLTENPDLFWALKGGGCNFGMTLNSFLYHSIYHSLFF